MSEDRFSNRAMTIVGLLLLILVAGAFLWLWFGYPRPDPEIYKSTTNLEPVDVSKVQSQGKTLLEGLKNNSGIPIPEPTGKEGRADPFAAL